MGLSGHDFPRPSDMKTYHTETYARISPKTSGFDGKGKTVLVTGGSAGIGFSICRAFAEAGVAKIVFTSRSAGPQKEAKEKLESAYPDTKFETFQASADDLEAMTRIIQSVGPIDVLVHNAAFSPDQRIPSKDIAASDVLQTFQTNVIAAYHMITTYLHAAAPASGEKTIIAVSSAAANVYIPQQVAYASSKAALSKMICALADEHAPATDGVRMVSFHPGIIYTAAAAQFVPKEAFEWEDLNMTGNFAVWLAGKESEFLHGRFVWAQWDVDELLALKEKMANDRSFLKIGLMY
ncbi:hypothetical protein LTR37_015089 [Vermiconidia calcicola]|uniref:Uncharacterized protein n=1 Tax=Vermiconidia calcicola TaxID=1690605 RepID=A0ACC3MT52_9PEZI|nr:hypothetical protein LTR37_015089 [Vermiconidia calcicola]